MVNFSEYSQAGERVATVKLANGLTCQFVPKPAYHKTYAMFTTNFGSIDNRFRTSEDGEFTTVPAGTAHFLEHKLFDKEDYDAFDLFGHSGASSNAFTSATQTSYLFSATTDIAANIEILLNFVQDPYFTDATVEKEKGIIGQEIQMYQDDAGWQLYSGILGNLYPTHPLHIDVAGSVESIATITPEILHAVHAAFYSPSNMTLTVVGNFNVEEILDVVTKNQAGKDLAPVPNLERNDEGDYETETILPYRVQTLPISRGKGIVGVKGTTEIPDDSTGMRTVFAARLFLELIFGDSGETYLDLYNRGVIDDSFFTEFVHGRGFNYMAIGGDSNEPTQLTETLIDALENYKANPDFNAVRFGQLKRASIGKFFASLNSIESIANQLASQSFGSVNPFLTPEILDKVSFTDVEAVAAQLVKNEALSVFHIMAKEDAE